MAQNHQASSSHELAGPPESVNQPKPDDPVYRKYSRYKLDISYLTPKEKEKEKEKAKQWFNVPVFYNSVRCKEEDVERALASSMFETWKENMKANVNIFTTCLKIDSVVYIPQTHQAIKYVKMSAIVYTKESYEAYLEYPEREKEREQQRLLHPEEPAKEPVKENEKETKARKEKERNAVLKNIPGICFLRGPRVSVLVVIPTETEEFTVLSVNRRISVAKPAVPELPSGDIDETGDFVGEVADQLKEELEIQIKEMDLVDLTQLAFGNKYPGMFPSCGGCDEYVVLHLYRAQKKTLKELSHKKAELDAHLGSGAGGDRGKLRLVSIKELWKVTPDSSALSALAIYSRLKQPGIL